MSIIITVIFFITFFSFFVLTFLEMTISKFFQVLLWLIVYESKVIMKIRKSYFYLINIKWYVYSVFTNIKVVINTLKRYD